MPTCPYCHSEVEHLPEFRLTGKRKLIFDAVAAAGPSGISQELLGTMLVEEGYSTYIRPAIFYINSIIIPMRIVGRDKRYYLDSIDLESDVW
jgi:hypothetical protein